jgi:hypothetical protein
MYDANLRTVQVIDSMANYPELPIGVSAGHAKIAVGTAARYGNSGAVVA